VTPAAQEFARRAEPGAALAEDAAGIARACHAMAGRFNAGATLLAFGNGAAATDAQHIAVEFVHPVIVGKRALPAISLTGDVATITGIARDTGFEDVFAHQVRLLARPTDIALGVSPDGRCTNVLRALEAAKHLGLLTLALAGGDGALLAASDAVDHLLLARSDDPLVVKELQVTTYHVLWELVHLFLQQSAPPEALCHDDHCITCSDEALEARVVALRDGDMALVEVGSALEEVSVALVEARVGVRILVHAKEAIAVVDRA
jgi:D-sedoheptulose 7-phosphate isomerase